MVKWLANKDVAPMTVMPGDTLTLEYLDPGGRYEKIVHDITEPATFSTMAIGAIENELGFETGLVGVVGNRSQ